MRQFGSGVIWGTGLQDAFGSAIALPTPFQLGILQDVSIDISYDEKTLYGTNLFAQDVARGKGKIALKAKFANINALPFAACFFGQSVLSGLVTSVNDTNGVIVTAAAVVVTPPTGNTFFANLGVRSDANGTPMIRVASAPTTGQYTTDGNGSYTFAAADVGKTVFIDYQYFNSSAGSLLTVRNTQMGMAPFFRVDISMQRNNKVLTQTFNKVTASKLGMSTKQDDFLIPELDMTAIADDSGNVYKWSSSE